MKDAVEYVIKYRKSEEQHSVLQPLSVEELFDNNQDGNISLRINKCVKLYCWNLFPSLCKFNEKGQLQRRKQHVEDKSVRESIQQKLAKMLEQYWFQDRVPGIYDLSHLDSSKVVNKMLFILSAAFNEIQDPLDIDTMDIYREEESTNQQEQSIHKDCDMMNGTLKAIQEETSVLRRDTDALQEETSALRKEIEVISKTLNASSMNEPGTKRVRTYGGRDSLQYYVVEALKASNSALDKLQIREKICELSSYKPDVSAVNKVLYELERERRVQRYRGTGSKPVWSVVS